MKGTVEIVFTVYDLDLTSTIESTSDLVDTVFIYPDVPAGLSANDPFSDPMLFTGKASYSHLELAFRLTCGPHFYGPNCTFCVPSNDSTGHYSCDDRTGTRCVWRATRDKRPTAQTVFQPVTVVSDTLTMLYWIRLCVICRS